jgi:hypothetical protein
MRFGDSLFLEVGKDGGPKSRVDGFWLIRIKSLFSIALLRFAKGSRQAFHSHAFNSRSWLLTGGLVEVELGGPVKRHEPSLKPIDTKRDTFHKVFGVKDSNWVLTFRGPWADDWLEVDERGDIIRLTHNRVELERNGVRVGA